METVAQPTGQEVIGVNQMEASAVSPANRTLFLRVLSDTAYLAPVRHSIETFCAAHGFDKAAVDDIGLCVNEAMANVTRHAYSGAMDQPVEVKADFDGSHLLLTVRDWGSGQQPPTEPRHDPLTPGGVGIVCFKKLLDGFTFTKMPDGMLLTMKRTLTHGKAP